ncbi:Tol-Pal system beta propeller repeat protein TolB [Salinisphaera hydrothermalis]|uniref:Tol-Pal system protein TolB n=1 Tax=Salinisphaera hydrothermalis (strain C41B8) TaxID=1304275 RepID=A0A084IKJ9_SALHC|nr:Tol-Pal system beta propeller repeat protein TolB [Salinisphaera hydrothermalis]KEZ77233.1 translocation protein TolB [Salinisphaera hydrothermalis C41B8]
MKYKNLQSLVVGFATLCLMAIAVSPAQAALQVDITKSSDSAIPIAIVPFGSSQGQQMPVDVAQIASNDLASTGLFKIFPRGNMLAKPSSPDQVNYDNWRTQHVDNLVVGSASPNGQGGYKITFNLLDAAQGQSVASYQLNAGPNQLRQAGHTIANLLYQRFTGKKGYFLSRIAYVTVTGSSADKRQFRLVVSDYDGSHPSTVYSSQDPIMSPAWSPDGKKLAYVAFNVYKGVSSVRVQDLATGKVRTIASGSGVNGAPAWSPDGNRIALTKSQNGDSNIYVYNLSTGQMQQLTHSSSIDTEAAWSPDGQKIAFTSDRGGKPQIYEMSSHGGQVQRLTYDGQSNQRPDFSPDGKLLAMVQQSANGFRIAVMNLANNNVRVVSDGPLDDSPAFAPNGQAILYATQGSSNSLATVSVDGKAKSTLSQAGEVREPAWGPLGY